MVYIYTMPEIKKLKDKKHRKQICDALGIKTQAVTNWVSKGEVPIVHCASIEKSTKGAITRQDLRPDDWNLIWPELVKRHKKLNVVTNS